MSDTRPAALCRASDPTVPPIMSTGENNANAIPAAYSGRIIGAIVKALGLDDGVLTRRTARRFFQGKSVNEHSSAEIFRALGRALVDRGIVLETDALRNRDAPMADLLATAIANAASRWDSLIAGIQSRSATVEGRGIVTDRMLRFVVIDLSLRVFALLRLSDLDPPPPHTPTWAMQNGGGTLIRKLVARAGLTRHQLANRLNVSKTSVDNWLDGRVCPENDSIAALAGVLAGRLRDIPSDQLRLDIQRQLTFSAIGDLVESWIGRGRVVDLSAALVRFVWMITEDVRTMDRPPLDKVAGAEYGALQYGSDDLMTHALLRNLAVQLLDEDWRRDLLAVTVDRDVLFQIEAGRANLPRTAAGLAQDAADVPPSTTDQPGLGEPPGDEDPARAAVARLADEADEMLRRFGRGELDSAMRMLNDGIEVRRAIARNFPLSPLAHSELGSFLGMVGWKLRRDDLIDEAITECRIAAELLPSWDTPAVEPGIILINVGAHEEALKEFARARETLPVETPHLAFSMGYALMMVSRYAEALEHFVQVREARPDHALTSLYAAHCAFVVGDNWAGLRYAKAARGLGEPAAYIAWERGTYASLKKS